MGGKPTTLPGELYLVSTHPHLQWPLKTYLDILFVKQNFQIAVSIYSHMFKDNTKQESLWEESKKAHI